jgi:hypothetical protein
MRREADHTPPSSKKIKTAWSYTSIPHTSSRRLISTTHNFIVLRTNVVVAEPKDSTQLISKLFTEDPEPVPSTSHPHNPSEIPNLFVIYQVDASQEIFPSKFYINSVFPHSGHKDYTAHRYLIGVTTQTVTGEL